ncbi:unnamed protein product [Kluyveromyces dobzhanskii CBS 2104]|uniref:Ubiquitin-activating enzyme E1-like n=1 Tax=Kluyveromyces dobzhanskii CBS 2104 TaxID=1427455 RepID=A0A0A8L5F0_9SACH|nr:unnamed protein product [Kluyveromyces dobzhanskii CBS 2104]
MARETNLIKCIGTESYEKLRNTKVLLVGAGGIGCELLKDLLLLDVGEIHIVDLDTIDLSNLNRQFLFRKRDIKQPKSVTAVKAVQRYSNSKLVAYQNNIMDTEAFPLAWFGQFSIVYNALDNLAARRYVNKMCQFTGKPLIESGTSGFDGYIQPIFPSVTECFDCTAKETPTTFPVCTIRSTPSRLIHCVVWAKNFLFGQLFAESFDEGVSDQNLGTDDQQEIARIKEETNELHALQRLVKSGDETNVSHILKKLFVDDINKLLKIENIWKTRVKPTPLSILESSGNPPTDLALTWTLQENVDKFIEVTKTLMSRLKVEPFIEFDKDDEDTLLFVSCAANIRSHIFHIPAKSVFDIKQMAGNIIPAIATTNAIIAGLSSLVSLRVLDLVSNVSNAPLDIPMAFTARASSIATNRYLSNPTLAPKNPNCSVSSNIQRTVLKLTQPILDNMTLYNLNQKIISKYGFSGEFSVLDTNTNSLLYDFDFDDLEGRKLSRFNFKTGSVLLYKDEEMEEGAQLRQSIEFYLEISPESSEEELHLVDLPRYTYTYHSPYGDEEQDLDDTATEFNHDKTEEDHFAIETLIVDDEPGDDNRNSLKRQLSNSVHSPPSKAVKLNSPQSDDDLILLD